MPDPRRWWGLLLVAVQALTRLPVAAPHDQGLLRAAAPAFPVVGIGIGLLGGAVMLVTGGHLAALPAALLAIAATTLLTGALHEDGLADCCDALGARSRHDALRIMRDSHIGAFGTIGLVLVLSLRASLLAAVPAPLAALVAAHAASRFCMLVPGALLPYARDDGMAAALTRPPAASLVAAAVLGLGPLLLLGPRCAPALLLSALATAAAVTWARHRLGGFTGDVLGATQQLTETAVLLAAAWHAG